jgi:predicted nucleotidyltransferase
MIREKDIVIKLLSVLFPDAKIYLFGSRARGTHKVTSDVDLAIDIGTPIPSLELARACNVIEDLNPLI